MELKTISPRAKEKRDITQYVHTKEEKEILK